MLSLFKKTKTGKGENAGTGESNKGWLNQELTSTLQTKQKNYDIHTGIRGGQLVEYSLKCTDIFPKIAKIGVSVNWTSDCYSNFEKLWKYSKSYFKVPA